MAKRVSGAVTAVERRLVETFFKTVGSELGFYQSATKQFADGWESEPLYQTNLEFARRCLQGGALAEDLLNAIRAAYRQGTRAALLAAVVNPKRLLAADENLLEPGPVYHPALFVRRAPGYAIAGDTMLPITRGSVTRKEGFTFQELTDYYHRQVKIGDSPRRRDAEQGPWRWLIEQATLDEILFAVDAAGAASQRRDVPVSVLGLADYLDDARATLAVCRARRSE